MKILLTWEMDSDPAHLHHLRLITNAIRQHGEHHVILACAQPITGEQAQWFDEVLITNRIQFKHENSAPGILAKLSQLGWVAPDLRQTVFSAWAQLFRALKPDLIIAEASPGATLSAVLEEIPVITSSAGDFQVTSNDMRTNEHFPEFQDWLWNVTGQSYAQLLNRPGLVFAPQALDDARPGLVFHVNPASWPWSDRPAATVDALIYADASVQSRVQSLLLDYGLSSFAAQPYELVSTEHLKLVIGGYDRFTLSVAAGSEVPYLGIREQGVTADWVKRCGEGKLAFEMVSNDVLQAVIEAILASGSKSKPGVAPSNKAGFIGLNHALRYFLR